jgi:integrase
MLTLVKKRHWTRVINGKRYYWPLSRFTRNEAELESQYLEAETLRQKVAGNKDWNATSLYRMELQSKLAIGPFRTPAVPSAAQFLIAKMHVPIAVPFPSERPEGTVVVNNAITFLDLVNLFLTESPSLPDKKKRDLRNRLAAVKEHFNGTPLAAYTRAKLTEVANAVNAREISDYYKRDIFQAVYRLLSWAANRENLDFVPPGNLKEILTPIKAKKSAASVWQEEEGKYWEAKEVKAALSLATSEMRAFLLLGLNCAYSTSEIGALEKSHLKEGGEVIQTIRGKTARNARPAKLKHYLWPETTAAIKEAMDKGDSSFVFCTSSGGNVASNDYVGKLFREFCKANKLSLPNFKLLRKTSANDVKKASNSDIASLHLGHSTKTVTETFYTEANWQLLKDATDSVRKKYDDCF